MLIALYNGIRKRAEVAGSGALGVCPWTQNSVKAHVGMIRQYWAYVGGAPVMPVGYEPESEWHLTWKECVKDENCEVIFGQNNEHRADIVGASDTVVEIQRSPIDIRHSRERVSFYKRHTGKRVVWVVDIQDIWMKTFKLSGKKDSDGNLIINWKRRRAWLWDLAATTDTNAFLEFNQKNDKLL